MICRWTKSVPKEDIIIPKLIYTNIRCSRAHPQYSQMHLMAAGLVQWTLKVSPQHFQVHLEASVLLKITPGIHHPGILDQLLSHAARGSQWPKYISLKKWIANIVKLLSTTN